LFLASGMVANATFLDATGAAWPIERWAVSNQTPQAGTFNVTQFGRQHPVDLSSPKLFAVGNIAIKFKDLNTPVDDHAWRKAPAGWWITTRSSSYRDAARWRNRP
jgi:hypothetical protein